MSNAIGSANVFYTKRAIGSAPPGSFVGFGGQLNLTHNKARGLLWVDLAVLWVTRCLIMSKLGALVKDFYS